MVRIAAAVQQRLTKGRKIGRGTEKPGVGCNPADGEGIFVVNFALHQAMTKIVIDLRWRDLWPKFLRGAKHGVRHSQWIENIALGQIIKRAASKALDDFAH